MARVRRPWLAVPFLLTIAACSTATVENPPFTVGIDASRVTAGPGDSISFVVTAQGSNLVGLQVDYGDTIVDQYQTGGARTARVTFRHAYAARGTYTTVVTATDATAGQKQASVEIHVN